MVGQLRKSLSERLTITDLEREIRQMEVDLDYHRKKARIFEETLREQQHLLSKLQRRSQEKCIGGLTDE